MNDAKYILCFLYLLSIFLFIGEIAHAMDDMERAKIEYLISSVNDLKDARFIRNGSEYDTAAAANHLRRKLKAAGDKISTAEQFIAYCASKSSLSGEPYTIKMADGVVVQSGTYFRNKLNTFRENGGKAKQ